MLAVVVSIATFKADTDSDKEIQQEFTDTGSIVLTQVKHKQA